MYTPGHASGSAYAPSFWERLGTGWEFVKESMVMWTKDKDLILPSVLSLLTMGLGFAGLAGFLHLTGDLPKLIGGESDAELSAGAYVGFLAYGILAYIISYFYGGMTVHLVDVHLRGRDARLGEAFTDAILNLPAILILALISCYSIHNSVTDVYIALAFGVTSKEIGRIATVCQVGYGLGLLFFTPLGDIKERKGLILSLLGVVAVALAATAVSTNLVMLGISCFVFSFTTVIPQLILPLTAQLANPKQTGQAMGIVIDGFTVAC